MNTHGTVIQFNSVNDDDIKLIAEFRLAVFGIIDYFEQDHGDKIYFVFDTKEAFDKALKHVPICPVCKKVYFYEGGDVDGIGKCPRCNGANT
jgi:hypothetical protein